MFYWPSYNAYFAAIGDAEHRGHQVGAREALVSVVSIVAPLLGAWALVTFGPRTMFAAVGPGAGAGRRSADRRAERRGQGVRARRVSARRASARSSTATDGWFDAWYIIVWQIALFVSLGESVSAYGGAMALAALVGAGCGLLLGRHIDAGGGRRAVVIAYSVAAAFVMLRAGSIGSPWLAVTANALGALLWPLLLPTLGTAIYNLSKASPCPMRFTMVTEAGWDIGGACACLLAAALAAAGVSLSIAILLALPALLSRRYCSAAILRMAAERRFAFLLFLRRATAAHHRDTVAAPGDERRDQKAMFA